MAEPITRQYRNDSEQTYIIPGIGEIGPDQRVSIHSEFPPAINLANYPGVVDVIEEEAAGNGRDYELNPEAPYTPQVTESLSVSAKPSKEIPNE